MTGRTQKIRIKSLTDILKGRRQIQGLKVDRVFGNGFDQIGFTVEMGALAVSVEAPKCGEHDIVITAWNSGNACKSFSTNSTEDAAKMLERRIKTLT